MTGRLGERVQGGGWGPWETQVAAMFWVVWIIFSSIVQSYLLKLSPTSYFRKWLRFLTFLGGEGQTGYISRANLAFLPLWKMRIFLCKRNQGLVSWSQGFITQLAGACPEACVRKGSFWACCQDYLMTPFCSGISSNCVAMPANTQVEPRRLAQRTLTKSRGPTRFPADSAANSWVMTVSFPIFCRT